MLAQRYFDPTTGLYNYLQFHNDILMIGAERTGATVVLAPQPPSLPVTHKPLYIRDILFVFLRRRLVFVSSMRYLGGSGMRCIRMGFAQQSFSGTTTNFAVE